MLEIEAGEEILYVGDHLYSDVLRSKRIDGKFSPTDFVATSNY